MTLDEIAEEDGSVKPVDALLETVEWTATGQEPAEDGLPYATH